MSEPLSIFLLGLGGGLGAGLAIGTIALAIALGKEAFIRRTLTADLRESLDYSRRLLKQREEVGARKQD